MPVSASAVYFMNLRGDVLINRRYRDDVGSVIPLSLPTFYALSRSEFMHLLDYMFELYGFACILMNNPHAFACYIFECGLSPFFFNYAVPQDTVSESIATSISKFNISSSLQNRGDTDCNREILLSIYYFQG